MKTSAFDLLSEDKFWDIIKKSDKCKDLQNELSDLSENEIFGFVQWWRHFSRKAYTQELWAVATVVMGFCSDDGFIDFRSWLISRGKEVYYNALEDADSLYDELVDQNPSWEGVAYVAYKVYEDKFGVDYYEAEEDAEETIDFSNEPYPEMVFSFADSVNAHVPFLRNVCPDMDTVNEANLRKICPKIFDKWWQKHEAEVTEDQSSPSVFKTPAQVIEEGLIRLIVSMAKDNEVSS